MIDYQLRILIFLLFVSGLLAWQYFVPRSPLRQWRTRWRHNLSLMIVDALVVRLIQPLLLVSVAWLPAAPFALLPNLPSSMAFIAALILLDLIIYWQHRLFHRVPWLWRLHRVHHSDPELDTTSAVRFHPIEIALSLCIKALAVWALGVSVMAVLVFDILLNSLALFNHTNVRLGKKLERPIRCLIVTPDMHRIHHSRVNQEANCNFGFCLSLWDRLFASYTQRSQTGDRDLNIGLPQTTHYAPVSVFELLKMPFSLNIKRKNSPP